ncbi:MAG TPA: hypothetical protein PKJ41_01615 [Bryobacteraceae bacterium]|nr:hypothetical protein [Bryobacteraceae bacterium]
MSLIHTNSGGTLENTNIHLFWREHNTGLAHRTGVSLHGHTLHSREGLQFIPAICGRVPLLDSALTHGAARYRRTYGRELEFSRAWWTPPLSTAQALKVESGQIESQLGMNALVSLTDHDNIDGAASLGLIDGAGCHPVSVEWTVPIGGSFVHIGVHNLGQDAADGMKVLSAYTASPESRKLPELLEWFAQDPAVLIVLNHPLWDERGIGEQAHKEMIESFLKTNRPSIHALEMNGLRSWKENLAVMDLANAFSLPVVSGGDRHGREPNAVLNVTNSLNFAEFVKEIRLDRWSDIMVMPHYRKPMRTRIIENLCEILKEDPAHPLGHFSWSDRVFYKCEDSVVRSLTELWGHRQPLVIRGFIAVMQLARVGPMTAALRAVGGAGEMA